MNTELSTIRFLGAAQLFVFIASMVSERLLASAVGSGSISEKLISLSNNLTRLRISNLVALLNSLGIIVLGVLFYIVFNKDYKLIALLALGCFIAEAITLAVSKIGAYALIPLSKEYVAAGVPEPSAFQTMGDFLYHAVDRRGYDFHMLFFCVGGMLWYYLLFISRAIPTPISLWGFSAICLLTVPVLMVLYDRDLTQLLVLGLPYAPYELAIGLWLLVRGFQ